jgi:hypothetical protein
MMEAASPNFRILALAIGAGLLAVFIVWVSKQLAKPETRSQGLTAAGIALGVLVLGFFGMASRDVVQMAPATVTRGTITSGTAESSVSIERSGMEVHVHSTHPPVAPPSAPATGSGPAVGQAHFAWGPIAIAVIVVGVIAIVVSSKRGLAAALACLGIVAAGLVMYMFAARSAPQSALIAEVAPRVDSPTDWKTVDDDQVAVERIQVADSASRRTAAEATREEKAEAEPASDKKADAKSATVENKAAETKSTDDNKAAAQSAPPAWVGSEPTMEGGVYRAEVVSGPYSTRRECETQLDEPLRKAMMEYANDHLPYNVRFHAWGNASYIRNNLIEERYLAQEQYGVGKMYNLHVRLKVDADDVARFNAVAHEWRVRQAVEETSIGGLFVLGSLVVAYGALRYGCCKKRASQNAGAVPTPPDAAA